MENEPPRDPNNNQDQPQKPRHIIDPLSYNQGDKGSPDLNTQATQGTPPPKKADPLKAKQDDTGEKLERSSFIKWLALGWIAFAAIMAGYGTLFMRFLFPNVLFEPKQSFLAGYPKDFTVGEVSDRFKAKHAVWIVRDSKMIYVLSTVCTHLGCTPNWLGNEKKFKCPCHGSGFYKTGINFEGPAPRPLERFKIGFTDEGEILIDKTKKFQQEKGEWSDPESFILV